MRPLPPPPVTVTQCAVLVGGLGTRLGARTTAIPKPLLTCGGRPFLAWPLRHLMRFGVTDFLLLAGHLAEEIERALPAIRALLPRPVTIGVSREPERAGTGGAVFHARDRLRDTFWLCNGDSLFDANLGPMLAAAAADGPGVAGRMLARHLPDASRCGVATLDGDRVTSFRERPPETPEPEGMAGPKVTSGSGGMPGPGGRPGLVNAGVYLFDKRRLLDGLAPTGSLEADVLPVLAAAGTLRATVADGYFRDIGVPDDFDRADAELRAMPARRALFLDRDGVVNIDRGYVGSRDRFAWMPGAPEAIQRATAQGWHVFIVTNQSGIARGLYDEAGFDALMAWVADEARRHGGTIDDLRHCPFHPEALVPAYRAHSDWRKPEPGMLLDLIRAWDLDPARCVMIGDQETDLRAAAAAGIAGHRFMGGNLLDFARPILERAPSEGASSEGASSEGASPERAAPGQSPPDPTSPGITPPGQTP